MKNDIEKSLTDIWSKYQNDFEKNAIFNRGFVFSIPRPSDILITGINPSFNGQPSHSFCFEDSDYRYFKKLKKLTTDSTYLDLFNIRGEQFEIAEIAKQPKGIHFLAEQLRLTQLLIENYVKPKLILVFNKGSWGYWGFDSNPLIVWMGYDFEHFKDLEFGKLMRITGLQNSPLRISQDISTTYLTGCLVYFSNYLYYSCNETLVKIRKEIEEINI